MEEEDEEGCLVDKECFPMGCRNITLYEKGWIDIACGPSITIDIKYSGHHHNPQAGNHTPLLPSELHVDIDVPEALIRVFGCLARDLLGLKVSICTCHCFNGQLIFILQENYPGEYIKMTPFKSGFPCPPSDTEPTPPPLSKAPVPPSLQQWQGPHTPQERTINIFVSFKLRTICAEFPTVSEFPWFC